MSDLTITGSHRARSCHWPLTPKPVDSLVNARRYVTRLLLADLVGLDLRVRNEHGEVVARYASGEGWT